MEETILEAKKIVIIQADNPDGDSLASALALEQILSDMDKEVHMYCGVAIPTYLRYMDGWDRVYDELPIGFDASIIVDTSAIILLEKLQSTGALQWVKAKPCIVLDHHTASEPTIDFASTLLVQEAVSTGELIYELGTKYSWPMNLESKNFMMTSIMSDSMGLTTDGTSARSIAIVSELVAAGVSIPQLENNRRALQKKSPQLLKYKASLIDRVSYSEDGKIAWVLIPWEEIQKYSQEYNPSVLVIDEMRQVKDVSIAIAFKTYPDGRITAKLRANYGFPVAAEVAQHFGGGGHPYAAGFRVTNKTPFDVIKAQCLEKTSQLLATIETDETSQHTYSVG